jgi:hypothetical protein
MHSLSLRFFGESEERVGTDPYSRAKAMATLEIEDTGSWFPPKQTPFYWFPAYKDSISFQK